MEPPGVQQLCWTNNSCLPLYRYYIDDDGIIDAANKGGLGGEEGPASQPASSGKLRMCQ